MKFGVYSVWLFIRANMTRASIARLTPVRRAKASMDR